MSEHTVEHLDSQYFSCRCTCGACWDDYRKRCICTDCRCGGAA